MKQVLHVVYNLNVGGIETWLMHVLRRIDHGSFQMDFLVDTTESCAYDDEARSLGSRIISAPSPIGSSLRFARAFKHILAEHGPYDVVHSHLRLTNGLVLRLARRAGVPVRIAHMHSVALRGKSLSVLSRALMAVLRRWLRQHMTVGLGVSGEACTQLFGPRWETDPRVRVLHCGVDLAPFHADVSRADVRRELGLPDDACVVGHVGRFGWQKNHAFFLDTAAELLRGDESVHFLLVGDGALREGIENRLRDEGMAHRFVLCGVRGDVARILLGAVDVMLFPSISEGLPLTLLEAQAAGVPCVYSDVITDEVNVVRPLMRSLSLDQPASAWADAVLDMRRARERVSPADALAAMEHSDFHLDRAVEALQAIYMGCD